MGDIITFEVPNDYGSLTEEELNKISSEVEAAFAQIKEIPKEQLTDAHIEALETLAGIVEAVRAEREHRETIQQRSNELLASLEAAIAAPAANEAEAEQATQETEAEAEAEREPALAAAAKEGGARTTPRIQQIARHAPTPRTAPKTERAEFARLVQGAHDGREARSWLDIARDAESRLASYNGLSGFARNTVATIHREFSKDMIVGEGDAELVLSRAADESRLPGGSLVAAAGWCSPSQTIFDILELESPDGIVDLPEVQVTRGGIRHNPGPDFSVIYQGTWSRTEAQVISGTTKPTVSVPCPNWVDDRLEAVGVFVTSSLLQQRGYPEMIERFIRGSLTATAHKANEVLLGKMVAGSTAVDLSAGAVDGSAASELLSAVELAVEDIRYRARMPLNATVEVVLPRWAFALMRADIARREGVDMLAVTDAVIAGWFAARNARVQGVYDWQDAFSGVSGGFGGATAVTAYPETVQFLAYPAGTWVRGSDSVIRLDTVYDSSKLATNEYVALFAEDGVTAAKRGNDSRVYTVKVCPSGKTAGFTCGA